MVQGADPDRLHRLIGALIDAAAALDRIAHDGGLVVAHAAEWCRQQASGMARRIAVLTAIDDSRGRMTRDAQMATAFADALSRAGLGAAGLRARADRDRHWLADDRKFLSFDPRGDGRLAEVYGDLATAVNIAVIVPGVGTTMTNFDHVGAAAAELARTAAPDGATAVIAWLGYDPPNLIPLALTARRAIDGAAALNAFLDADVPADTHLTLIGHSYGSLVVGLGARHGATAGDIVLLGSPGVDARSVADLDEPEGTAVWAARAPGDPIGLAVDPLAALGFGIAGVWEAHHRGRLVFGQDPASVAFGAVRLATGPGVQSHGDYFKPGSLSLENLARIADGRRGDVVLEIG